MGTSCMTAVRRGLAVNHQLLVSPTVCPGAVLLSRAPEQIMLPFMRSVLGRSPCLVSFLTARQPLVFRPITLTAARETAKCDPARIRAFCSNASSRARHRYVIYTSLPSCAFGVGASRWRFRNLCAAFEQIVKCPNQRAPECSQKSRISALTSFFTTSKVYSWMISSLLVHLPLPNSHKNISLLSDLLRLMT